MKNIISLTLSTFKSKAITSPCFNELLLCAVWSKQDKRWKNLKHLLSWLKPCLLAASLLLSTCVTLEAHTYVAKGDSLALVDLYNATNGKNWTMRGFTTWNLNQPVDTWNYVVIRNNRVVGLDLHNSGLIGTIPASIGDLSALDFLDLSYNQLSGNIPSSLSLIGTTPQANSPYGKLWIDLSRNQLTGGIPSSLGDLRGPTETSLGAAYGEVTLVLSFNQLTGSIPSSLSNLLPLVFGNSLSYVDLDYNNLSLSPTPSPFVKGGTSFRYVVNGKVNNISTNKSVELSVKDNIRYVSSPANGAVNVNTSLSIYSSQITSGSPSTYTIQLSESPDFSSIAFEQTGPTRALIFSGLKYNTHYYNRVKTDLSPSFGSVGSFTTRSAESVTFVLAPADNAINKNVTLNITTTLLSGATSYSVDVSPDKTFATGVISNSGATRTLSFSGLAYGTTYYARVKTNLSPNYGKTTSFTTIPITNLYYITSPANNAANVPYMTNVIAHEVPNATQYTIELNPDANFGTGTAIVKTSSGRTIGFQLSYDTKYYARVATDIDDTWGTIIKSFTTGDPMSFAYVTSPKNGGNGVPNTVTVYSNTVIGATNYTIELNTSPDFNGASIIKTSSMRHISFSGLASNQTYYTRVLTDLSGGQWGSTITDFTTANPVGRSTDDWVGEIGEEEAVEFGPMEAKVYPNPFRDKLSVHVQSDGQGDAYIMIYDLSGKESARHVISTNNPSVLQFQEMSSGFYIMKIATNQGIIVKKLIRE